ncbi:hypothetical protein LTR15_012905 [Elasticomyces elasticus]|nr:hypothetical protein LTR15_012905 [Elasticomyces elasticus]
MVTTDLLPGIAFSVTVNGQALEEYEDHDQEPEDRKVIRYVEACSGQTFEIRTTAQKGFKTSGGCLAMDIYIDGSDEPVDRPLIRNVRSKSDKYTHVSLGCQKSMNEARLYCFAPLKTAEDGPTFMGDPTKVKDLGSIVIKLQLRHALQTLQPSDEDVASRFEKKAQGVGALSEKSVKGHAFSHTVSLGDAVATGTTNLFRTTAVGGVPDPYAIIEFRYRSLESLKAMLIIPRTPSPPPLEDRDFDSLSREELQQLHQRMRAIRETSEANVPVKQEIKRERTDDNPRPRKVARPNRASTVLEFDDDNSVRESSTATFAPGSEVVDLTDD